MLYCTAVLNVCERAYHPGGPLSRLALWTPLSPGTFPGIAGAAIGSGGSAFNVLAANEGAWGDTVLKVTFRCDLADLWFLRHGKLIA